MQKQGANTPQTMSQPAALMTVGHSGVERLSLTDSRPEAFFPGKIKQMMNNSPQVRKAARIQEFVNNSFVTQRINITGVRQNNISISKNGVTGKSGIIQRKIGHDGTVFTTDGTRPGWRAFLKKSTADELGVAASSNFGTLGYDRAHRIPFAAIEELVCDYCNMKATDAEFEALTDSLYDISSGEYDVMASAREDLKNSIGGTISYTKAYANTLLSLLNSATKNVSPGDFSENRGIQDHPDYGYEMSPSGQHYDLTPRSKDIHDAWSGYGREPDFPMTPGGEHVRSSQISSVQQGSGTEVKLSDVNL